MTAEPMAAATYAAPTLHAVEDRPVPVVNLPNVLTVGRLLSVPVFAVLLVGSAGNGDGWLVAAWAVFTAACITDVVDGRLARSRGLVTEFGTFADPVADKALVGTALLGLSWLGVLPWWVTAVVIGREVAVTALRTAVLRHGVIPASRGGKLKALSQNIAVALYLLPLTGTAASLRVPVLAVALVATVATGVDYALNARRAARERATACERDVGAETGDRAVIVLSPAP